MKANDFPLQKVMILTFYTAQEDAWEKIPASEKMDVEVRSVDGSQGSEKRIVILDFVRYGTNIRLFVDVRPLCVAFSRAKNVLIGVGHRDLGAAKPANDFPEPFAGAKIFRQYVNFHKLRDLIFYYPASESVTVVVKQIRNFVMQEEMGYEKQQVRLITASEDGFTKKSHNYSTTLFRPSTFKHTVTDINLSLSPHSRERKVGFDDYVEDIDTLMQLKKDKSCIEGVVQRNKNEP
ncbi:MAG: hypothetical protein L6R40_008768 [Gallowayella cf. fulva]|nr:MAG: hypothetical protein L6R40_008768 [Xanthomendoza cf. fulva]